MTAKWRLVGAAAIALLALGKATAVEAQERPDPAKLMAAQKEAMAKLASMDGTWRGSAWTVLPTGEKHTLTQTERVGPMLDGTVKVIEGRGYEADGRLAFNAFGTISYNPATQAFVMRSHAMGNAGEFPLTVTADGFSWEIPAGPMKIRYTAVIKEGTWNEVGDRLLPGRDPVRFLEMNLKRLGDTAWPAADPVGPK